MNSRLTLGHENETPNTLLLGRTTQGGDTGEIDLFTHPWRRLRAIQIGVDMFWKKWSELAGPNSFIRPKWHQTRRNVKIGDAVWIADQNALWGQFRLGRIQAVYPDKKGLVRDLSSHPTEKREETSGPHPCGRPVTPRLHWLTPPTISSAGFASGPHCPTPSIL